MAIKLKTGSVVTVVTAGIAVPISTTLVRVASVVLQSDVGNTKNVFFGDSTVSETNGQALGPGESAEITGPHRPGGTDELLLDDLFVDSIRNGAQVRVAFFIHTRRG